MAAVVYMQLAAWLRKKLMGHVLDLFGMNSRGNSPPPKERAPPTEVKKKTSPQRKTQQQQRGDLWEVQCEQKQPNTERLAPKMMI